MQSTINVPLVQSGYAVSIPNSVGALSGGSLSVVYTVNGAPATLVIVVQGVINATGDALVLDTYSGSSNATRTVNLTQNFDSFMITATWTGGSSSVSVGAAVTMTGPGLTFSAAAVGEILVGIGSPEGVLDAPEGSLYVSTSGGASETLFVKESGGSTNSGWVGK